MKYQTWESQSGNWYCGDVNNLGKAENQWWFPARRQGISLSSFVDKLINKYHAKITSFKNGNLIYYFEGYNDARNFINAVNKGAV